MEEKSSVLGDALIRAQQITVLQRKSREGTSCFASKRADQKMGRQGELRPGREKRGRKQTSPPSSLESRRGTDKGRERPGDPSRQGD